MQQKKLRSRTPELFTLFQRDFLPAWPLILLRAYPRAGWFRPLMRPGPKNNPFGAHRPKKNAPSGAPPKPKKLPRPASPNRKIAPSGAPPGRMVSSSGALSDQKNVPASTRFHRQASQPARPRTGWSRLPVRSPGRRTSPGRCAPGLNGLTDRPGPNNLADRYAPRTEKLLRPAASLGCPSLGCPRGVCSSSDASPGGRSAAARYRVVPGSRW